MSQKILRSIISSFDGFNRVETIFFGSAAIGGIVGANVGFYQGMKISTFEQTYDNHHYLRCYQGCDCDKPIPLKINALTIFEGLQGIIYGAGIGAAVGSVTGVLAPVAIPAMAYIALFK